MATLEELAIQGVLSRAFPAFKPDTRQVWVTSRVETWIKNELPKQVALPRDEGEKPVRPLLQAKLLLERFISGREMYEKEDFWLMRPGDEDVYELKSLDVRFFGWFPEPKKFVVAAAASMEDCHTYDLHNGYKVEVVNIRGKIDLFPKLVVGAEPKDVF